MQYNVWQTQTHSDEDALLKPNLTAKWKLDALFKAFPLLEHDVIEATWLCNEHVFENTKKHLIEMFPDSCVDVNVQPTSPMDVRASSPSSSSSSSYSSSSSSYDNYSDAELAELESKIGYVLDNVKLDAHAKNIMTAESLRNEAVSFANTRSKLFRAAAESFMVHAHVASLLTLAHHCRRRHLVIIIMHYLVSVFEIERQR